MSASHSSVSPDLLSRDPREPARRRKILRRAARGNRSGFVRRRITNHSALTAMAMQTMRQQNSESANSAPRSRALLALTFRGFAILRPGSSSCNPNNQVERAPAHGFGVPAPAKVPSAPNVLRFPARLGPAIVPVSRDRRCGPATPIFVHQLAVKESSRPMNRTIPTPIRLHVPGLRRSAGLGTVLKRVTALAGFRACGGCQRRASALNRRVVFVASRGSR